MHPYRDYGWNQNYFQVMKEIIMETNPNIILEDCPICRGSGFIVHEGGWNVQVACTDCSAHTVYVEYENEAEKKEAELQVARLWNLGKVIKSEAGE